VTTPLLVAATLLAGSLYRLEGVDAGYESPNALTAALLLPTALYHDPADVDAFWKELEARLTAVPGVTGIAFSDGLPPDRVDNVNNFDLEDDPTPPGESQPAVPWLSVSEGYFELMGIPLLRGRAFDQRDADAGGDTPIVVDRAWAERFFPGGDALGERLLSGGCSPETCGYGVVVGVVGNVKYQGLDANDSGVVYAHISSRADDHPIPSLSKRFRYVVVRTSSSPRSLLPAVVRTVSELEPSVPVSRIATLDELMAATLDAPRKLSALVVAVGGVALLLSIVGVYGLMSYFVQSQRREIGIRLALGSRPGSVLWRVTGQGLALVALGTAVGLCASAALGRSLSGLLFEIQPLDPAVLGSVPAATLILALMACLPPARRAAAVDPALTLREE